jgi:Fic family protein
MAALRAIGKYQGKQELYFKQSPEVLKNLQEAAIIESTESSNRIEGITAPHTRIEKLVLETTTPKNRSEQEVSGYRDALALIHESGKEMPFSTNIVLQLHKILCSYLPDPGGQWKMSDNDIVEKNLDGSIKRIRFKPIPAFQTDDAMRKLAENYKMAIQSGNYDPMILIPLVIFDFLCIHPFRDGNGRIARLLTLMLMYHYNYEVGRYISLERIFEQSKESYYETLEESSKRWHQGHHNIHPWLDYYWGVITRAYRELEERVGTIRSGRGAKTEQVRLSIERKNIPFSISDIETACPGVSRDTVRAVLRQMRKKGIISSLGKGRHAKWIRNA